MNYLELQFTKILKYRNYRFPNLNFLNSRNYALTNSTYYLIKFKLSYALPSRNYNLLKTKLS